MPFIHDSMLVIKHSAKDGDRIWPKEWDRPTMFVVWFEPENEIAKCERVSFSVAKALAPEKYEEALTRLEAVREVGRLKREAALDYKAMGITDVPQASAAST